jgi:glycosyltransferase involved in cell wall biosynthesis
MGRLRVLVLGPGCNPEQVSIPLVTYSHAAALAKLHDITLVAGSVVEEQLRRSTAAFCSIEVVRTPLLDRLFSLGFRVIFRSNYASQAVTAFSYPFSISFELRAWRQFRHRIHAGEFDVVLRLMPLTAVLPSPFAFFLRKGPIPFVIGPVNGGLPFVPGFSQAQKQKEWISGLRRLYRCMPFARSTYRKASAIIAASSQTYSEFVAYSDKLFFIPENGVSRAVCNNDSGRRLASAKLQLIFVGALIPCKACDIAIRAAAPLLSDDMASLIILGDGPERANLEQLTMDLGVAKAVTFRGWVSHGEVLSNLRCADALVFPSVRDFGGGVLFEALAAGAVPIVVDFGGPGDIVRSDFGIEC